MALVLLAEVYLGKTTREGNKIAQETGGRVVTPGREVSGGVQEKETVPARGGEKETVPTRGEKETVPERRGEKGIIPEKMVPEEERRSIQGKEMTIDKETMAETTDPSKGTGAAASLPGGAGAVPEAEVPIEDKVATTEDDTGLALAIGCRWVQACKVGLYPQYMHCTAHNIICAHVY